MTTEQQPSSSAPIDTTPISPTADGFRDRRNSLEKHLQNRPAKEELKKSNILPETKTALSPNLQSIAQDLERNITADKLNKKLSHRPEEQDLINRNILPAVEDDQREKERLQRADDLERALRERKDKETLVKEGILEEDAAAPKEV